jgi:outer membrane receptor for ferric coprogen and ferric-rhodotorulic acid
LRQSGFYGQVRFRLADPLTVIAGARVSDYLDRERDVPPSARSAWETYGKESGVVTPYAGLIFDVTRQVSLYASHTDIFAPFSTRKYGGGESLVLCRVGAQGCKTFKTLRGRCPIGTNLALHCGIIEL